MAQTRLGSILEQEYKSKGLISGATSAIGKRARESMDFRNVLFGGSGLGSIIGRKIFGRGYSATRGVGSGVSSVSRELSSSSSSQLDELNINSRITAKNTLALPSMARDMHLVKQNIIKLVKLQGGTPTTKAGDWFNRQAAREAAFEAKFGTKPTSKTTQVTKDNKDGSLLQNVTLLSGLFGTLGKSLTPIIGVVSAVALGLRGISKVIFGILRLVMKTKLGKILGLSAAAFGLTQLAGGEDGGELDIGVEPNGNKEMSLIDKGIVGVEGAMGAAAAVAGTKGAVSAVKGTSNAVLNARTMSVGQMAKSTPTSKWSKFLVWLAKRSPNLFAKVGLKLAQAGALMAIPIGGWIMALINLGFAAWTAWDIYQFWKEYNNSPEANEDVSTTSNTPTQLTNYTEENYDNLSSKSTGPTTTAPIPTGQGSNDMAELIRKKFRDAGFSEAQAEAAVANAIAESGLNPSARNQSGKEDSVGLFQMNRNGGLGTGHSVENLMDPNYNIDLAIAAAKKSKSFLAAKNVNDAVSAFVRDVERPKNQSAEIQKRIQIAQGGALNDYSRDVAAAYRNTGNTTYVDQSQRTTNNNGGSTASAPPPANVLDGEFAKLLARMV